MSTLTREQCPQPSLTRIFPIPIPFAAVVHFAIAVVAVAIKAFTVWSIDLDLPVNDFDALLDQRIVGWLDAEPHKFKKTGIHDLVLFEKTGTVVQLDLFAGVRERVTQ